MKKKVTFLGAEESKKALNMLQNCLRPEGINRIIFSKENTGYETRREISFCVCVDKNEYKQLKAYAQAADAENEETQSDESNTENNEEDENEMAEILRKICEFQTLKEIRIPSDDIPVEDGVKRIVIKLKD